MSELFDLVDTDDRILGTVARETVHGRPELIHRVSHVLVFNRYGELFLQKRALTKDVQPGKWDTSVGGHLSAGETYTEAAFREMAEELGITGVEPVFCHKYLHRNNYESEYVSTFRVLYEGPFHLQQSEIDDGRFWSLEEVRQRKEEAIFTPNFLDELDRILPHIEEWGIRAPD